VNAKTAVNIASMTHEKGMDIRVRTLRAKINEKITRDATASPR
jgi:hypothetical protein